jgi:hypothetical protein
MLLFFLCVGGGMGFCFVCLDRVLLYSPDWSQTHDSSAEPHKC